MACIGLTAWSAGCGGGGSEPLVATDSLRDCLAKQGATFAGQKPSATGFAPLFHLAADLQGGIAGSSIDIFIEKTPEAARRDAADARGALSAIGISDPAGSVVVSRNAVVVFEPQPSAQARALVRSCL
jgi:hypothetical protein